MECRGIPLELLQWNGIESMECEWNGINAEYGMEWRNGTECERNGMEWNGMQRYSIRTIIYNREYYLLSACVSWNGMECRGIPLELLFIFRRVLST